jgi:hypothetical protein
MLLANQKESQQKLERLSNQGLSCEYRLQAVERRLGDTVPTTIR